MDDLHCPSQTIPLSCNPFLLKFQVFSIEVINSDGAVVNIDSGVLGRFQKKCAAAVGVSGATCNMISVSIVNSAGAVVNIGRRMLDRALAGQASQRHLLQTGGVATYSFLVRLEARMPV